MSLLKKELIPIRKYVILFLVDETGRTVYISGVFHEKEHYSQKL